MKREIKFRAWLPKLCKMIYIGSNRNDTAVWICEGGFNVVDHFTGSPVSLGTDEDGAELMQFTGLRDENGKEIYEGDILDFDEREWGGRFKPEVVWMKNIIGDWNYCGSLSDVKEWRRVIGNIYENPELLKS